MTAYELVKYVQMHSKQLCESEKCKINETSEDVFKSFLENSHVSVSRRCIKLVQGWDFSLGLHYLSKEIQNGFWVYSFNFSTDYSEFKWLGSKERAEAFYKTLPFFLPKELLRVCKNDIFLPKELLRVCKNDISSFELEEKYV